MDLLNKLLPWGHPNSVPFPCRRVPSRSLWGPLTLSSVRFLIHNSRLEILIVKKLIILSIKSKKNIYLQRMTTLNIEALSNVLNVNLPNDQQRKENEALFAKVRKLLMLTLKQIV